jgi:histidine phosphotransferase ChpT
MSLTEDQDSDTAPQTTAPPGLDAMPGLDLASLLASRMCHDFISPASAIQSGLDLLEDPQAQDMRDDAMALISGSARKLVDMLQFSRVAFGGGAESYSRDELEALAKGLFAHHRGELDWSMGPETLNKAAARALVNLAAVAAAALPMGGTAKIAVEAADDGVVMTADCAGQRARLRPELLAGLKGEGPGEGLAGHWIQAAWTQALIAQAGGRLSVTTDEGQVRLEAWLPV